MSNLIGIIHGLGGMQQIGTYDRETGEVQIERGYFLTELEYAWVGRRCAETNTGQVVFPFTRDLTKPVSTRW